VEQLTFKWSVRAPLQPQVPLDGRLDERSRREVVRLMAAAVVAVLTEGREMPDECAAHPPIA